MAITAISPNFLPAAITAAGSGAIDDVPQCAMFTPQTEALTKASGVVSAYFRSMQQLAAFNSTTVSGPGQQAASNLASAAGLNLTQVDSTSKLAGLLTQAFTERYKQGNLEKILTQADPNIASVTQGFEDIISKDYLGLLKEEQQTLAAEYQAVGTSEDTATILLLNRAFSEDTAQLTERKTAAKAYVEALQQIRNGHHTLAANAKKLSAKDLAAALQNYSDKLTALLPSIEKHL